MSVGLLQIGVPVRPRDASRPFNFVRQAILVMLCLLWFVPGIVGRSPWKPVETTVVPAVMESMAAGDVLVPRLFGKPFLDLPPLYSAAASVAVHAFTPALEPHEAMRLPNFLWLALGLALAGCAVGWQHGSRIGWRTVLLVTGSPTLLLHARTVNPDVVLLAVGAGGIIGAHLLREQPLRGSVMLGLVAIFGVWACGTIALWYVGLLVLLPLWQLHRFHWRNRAASLAVVLLGAVGLGLWLLLLHAAAPSLPGVVASQQLANLQPVLLVQGIQVLLSDGILVLWPALPFAALAVVRTRHQAHYPAEVSLAFLALCAGAVAFVCSGELRESRLFLLLPAVATMAAVNVGELSREIAKAMDWFAVVVIGGGLIGFFWVAWLLAVTGSSPMLLAWLADQGVRPPAVSWSVGAAVLATLLWIGLMLRIGRSPERTVLNWMAGTTMGWWVFTLLWLPVVDEAKGYAMVAARLQPNLPSVGCVQASGLNPTVRAQLEYYTGRHFAATGERCRLRLLPLASDLPGEVVWSGGRSSDREHELLALVRVE